jgi:transcriptional regulator with XRE-family HTH domain
MNDVRFGVTVRVVRIRRRWRQRDLAERAGISREAVSRIEGGDVASFTLDLARRVCAALEIDLELLPRGRGAELDRLLNARHSALHESVARWLADEFPDWILAPEVSFNVYGERGVIDLLAWHPGRRALLIIEFKTEIVDTGDLVSTMDRRRRLAREVVRDRGWEPATVSTWVILARSRTNERRLSTFRTTLRAAFPDDGRRLRSWLADPVAAVSGLSLWSGAGLAPIARVTRVGRTRRAA